MTTPKVGTIQRGGSRFYVHPSTRAKVPGVTSVVGMLPKEFLKFWAAKVVAETAVENLGAVVTLAMKDPQGAIDYLKRAPQRNTGQAADVGSEVHDLVDRLAHGERIGRVHPELKGYIDGYHEFRDAFDVEYLHIEETVWSDSHGYAGSFDAIARIKPAGAPDAEWEVVVLDNKTTRSGVHAEVALQLSAYKNADYILQPDGRELPLPAVTGGAVLHLRPDGWSLVPVAVTDDIFALFTSLIPVLQWERETSKTVLGVPLGGRRF